MKKIIRKQFIEERKKMTVNTVNTLSTLIIERILGEIDLESSETIALYYPFNNEVNVLPLIELLLKQKKRVVLPKVTGKTTMEFYRIESTVDVELSKFGVYEPNTKSIVNKIEIDWMLIPGVGFNSKGYRLGYGAGYYDRYLEEHQFKTVGICFDFQITDAFEINEYDVPLDFIISENRLLQFHNADYFQNPCTDN